MISVVAAGDILLEGLVFVELGAELIEIGDPDPRAQADRSLLRFKLTEEYLEEGGLAGAVGSDDAHLVAAEDGGGKTIDDLFISPGKGDISRHPQPSGRSVPPPGSRAGQPVCSRLRARSWRICTSARTLPSFRVRRALTPCLIQVSSLASFLSNSCHCFSSASSRACRRSR